MEAPRFRAVPQAFFALIFPDECRLCGTPLKEISRSPVCPDCLREPAPLDAEYFCVNCRTPYRNAHPLDEEGRCGLCRLGVNGYDAAYSYGAYEDKLRELLHLFKYRGIFTLARPLAELMLRAFPRDERFDLIVPMPMHWLRRWRRGFNQSALLSKVIGRHLGIPVVGAVRRQRSTPPQAGLSNSQRRQNVSGAFSAAREGKLEGKRILLVDDVLTTGATASACSRVLKGAGVDYVAVLALARTDRRYQAEMPRERANSESFAVGAT